MTPASASETPETDAMTRLYRDQVAPVLPVLDTFAVVACTRILNKMAQIERERNQAVAKLSAQGEGVGLPDGVPGLVAWSPSYGGFFAASGPINIPDQMLFEVLPMGSRALLESNARACVCRKDDEGARGTTVTAE